MVELSFSAKRGPFKGTDLSKTSGEVKEAEIVSEIYYHWSCHKIFEKRVQSALNQETIKIKIKIKHQR